MVRSALHVDRSSATVHASAAVKSGVPHNLANPRGPWSASWATPAVMWSVSRSGIHDELQRIVCWCAVGLATDVAKDGMTTGGYDAQYDQMIRRIGHGSVGDEVIPSNT